MKALGPGSRYELLVRIASGGMATVYVARLRASQGVSRLVAVKRAHGHLTEDPEMVRMLVAEARLGAQIHHANVVAVQDVEESDGELLVIMDYVEGAALSELIPLSDDPRTSIGLGVRIVLDAAAGLHAAHELRDEHDRPLGIIHRDISPQNLLVGLDGVTRVGDFGIAKSRHATVVTSPGAIRGKLAYMAPEYLSTATGDRRIDVFGLGVVLWEALAGQRLFTAPTEQELASMVLECRPAPASTINPYVPIELDEIALKALERDPQRRFATVAEMRDALERVARDAGMLASHSEVAAMVAEQRRAPLAARRAAIRDAMMGEQADAPTVTNSFEVALERRDHEQTADLGVVMDQPLVTTRADPRLSFRPPALDSSTMNAPEPAWRAYVNPLLAGVALALALVFVWGLARRPKMAAPPPPEPAPAMVVPAATTVIEPVVVAPPPPSIAAPVTSTKRPKTRPTHSPSPTPAPAPMPEPNLLPTSDHSKPNPYLDAGAR